MLIRQATINDLNSIYAIEQACFLPQEAASLLSFKDRLLHFANHFWLIEDNHCIVAFINGMVNDRNTIEDEMFTNAALHNEQGQWQSVFGLAVLPDYRNKKYAHTLLLHLIKMAKQEHKKGITLTCKKNLIAFYEKYGFINAGKSTSVHGNQMWFNMQLLLNK